MKKPENENSSEGSPYDRLLQLYYERTFEGFIEESNEEENQNENQEEEITGKEENSASSKRTKFKKIK